MQQQPRLLCALTVWAVLCSVVMTARMRSVANVVGRSVVVALTSLIRTRVYYNKFHW